MHNGFLFTVVVFVWLRDYAATLRFFSGMVIGFVNKCVTGGLVKLVGMGACCLFDFYGGRV
jgi:hypothetical protein